MSDDTTPEVRVNTGYVLEQLRRAAGLAGEAAAARLEAWRQVVAGLADGTLAVGSRTPVADTPAWVTLEVLHGGFASGNLLAGGPLRDHERAALEAIEVPEGMGERAALNLHFLAGAGEAELAARLEDGRYRVEVPEEAAWLAVAALRRVGDGEAALALLEQLLPWTDRLRFYPVPTEAPEPDGEALWVRAAGEVRSELAAVRRAERVETQREALAVWTPWADAAVDLFLETMRGDWPLQVYPEGWAARARAHRAAHDALRVNHRRCGKPERRKETLAVLYEFLGHAADSPEGLDGFQVGRLRQALRGYLAKHGEPGSERRRALRSAQARVAGLPPHRELAAVLAARLEAAPPERGLDDPAAFLEPVALPDADDLFEVPRALRRRIERARAGTLEQLVEVGLLASSEQVARFLPALTALASATAYEDPAMGRLVARTYQAFRRRRSLLLLDLASQVGFGELPWVRALAPHGGSAAEAAGATLARAGRLVLRAFPQTPTPNKLVKELRALARGADIDLPLVEELAADIFMGTFSRVFVAAARAAGEVVGDTLYARYYGIPYDRVREFDAAPGETCAGFDALCRELAGDGEGGGRWSPAANGCVIEQAQVLTTHNLAALHRVAGAELVAEYPELARRVLTWVMARLQLDIEPWVPRLRNIKNAAFAWRQAVFFLALAEPAAAGEVLRWAREHLHAQPEDFVRRFEPALRGLELAHRGEVLVDSPEARRFLGWSRGRPWVMGPQ